MSEILTPTAERESLGGGRYRTTIHLKPVAYNDGGVLRRIATDWQNGDAGRPHIVTASRLMTSVAPDGARRIHPTREMDRYFEIGAPFIQSGGGWQQVPLGAPERSRNLLTWQTSAANLYIRHIGHAVKLAILLKNGWQPPNGQFAFPVGIQGLTRADDQLYADGTPVMRLRPFTVEDLDNPLDIRPVAHQIVNQGGQWYVVCTLPSLAGMSRPLIDPTFDEQPDGTDGIDTWLAQDSPTYNAGAHAKQYIDDVSWAGDHRALMKFDLSTLSGATVTSATLSTWSTAVRSGAVTIYCHAILSGNSGWTEGGATWNTKDGSNAWAGSNGCATSGTDYNATAMGSCVYGDGDAIGTQNDFTLDTDQVQDQVDGDNYGLILFSTSSSSKEHASSDNATAAYRPNIVIEYSEGGDTLYGAAALSGAGALTAAGRRRVWAGVTLAGTGALAAAARRTRFAAATLPGTGALDVAAIRRQYGASALAGAGSLSATGLKQLHGSAALSGAATLTAQARKVAHAAAALGGVGQLLAAARMIARGRATLAGVGSLAAVLTELLDNADLISTVTLTGTWATDVALSGAWSTEAALSGTWDQTVQLEGSVT